MKTKLVNICAIIGIFSIIFIIIPIVTGIIISVDGPEWLETNNEWIGYWGGYAGAIIGGLVTLYVMHETNKEARKNLEETLQIENQRILDEKRKEFNDEVLDLSFEYYIKVVSVLASIGREHALPGMMEAAEKVLVIEQKLRVKLMCKKNSMGYQYCEELGEAIKNTTREFQHTISLINKKDKLDELKKAISETNRVNEELHKKIATYYLLNESENVLN